MLCRWLSVAASSVMPMNRHTRSASQPTSMTMACRGCPMSNIRCGECVVTALVDPVSMGLPQGELPLDDAEQAALGALVRGGLVDADVARAARAHRAAFPLRDAR